MQEKLFVIDNDFVYLNDRFELIDNNLLDIFLHDDVFDCNVKFIIIYYIINNEKINENIEIIYINWSIIIWNKKKQFYL